MAECVVKCKVSAWVTVKVADSDDMDDMWNEAEQLIRDCPETTDFEDVEVEDVMVLYNEAEEDPVLEEYREKAVFARHGLMRTA